MKTLETLEQEAKQAREVAAMALSEVLPYGSGSGIADKLILAAVSMVTYQFAQADRLRNGKLIRIDDTKSHTFSVPIDSTRRYYVYSNGEIRVVPLDKIEESLPEVSQEERDSDGWIDWNGGDIPVDVNALVDIKKRDGLYLIGFQAGILNWSHDGNPMDIIAYRIVK